MVKRKSKEDVKTTVKVKKEKSERQKKIEALAVADAMVKESIQPKIKNAAGRPSKYTKELGEAICRKVACSPDGLKKLCKSIEWFPHHDTIMEWRFVHQEFSDQYKKAKIQQADVLAEDIVDIADDSTWDEIETEHGIKMNSEYVARSRLRVETRKWHLSKLLPKVYGERVQTENTHTIVPFEDVLKELG
jgi:hypothetical protein